MRHLRALFVLLALAIALPATAHADTGWSLEASGVLRPPPPPAAPAASVQPAAPGVPFGLVGAGAPVAAILAPASASAGPAPRPRTTRPEPAPDDSRVVHAAHSRHRAARRTFLGYAPTLARATVGITGYHASPPPPSSRA